MAATGTVTSSVDRDPLSKLSLSLCGSLLISLLLGQEGDQEHPSSSQASSQADAGRDMAAFVPSCTVCHPGQIRSLRRSPHHSLIREQEKDRTCLACHGKAEQHEEHPHEVRFFPTPALTGCVSCHEELRQIPGLARRLAHPRKSEAHQLLHIPSPRESLTLDGRSNTSTWPLFAGFVEMGYRFLSTSGNEGVFRQDFGIREGAMLRSVEASLRYPGDSEIFTLEGRDFGERASSADFETGKGLWEKTQLSGNWRRRNTYQDAAGDYYALDRRHEVYGARVDWELDEAADHEIGFEWERLVRRGQTLASSIGNPGQVPLQPTVGIPVDFRLQIDRLTTSYSARFGDTQLHADLVWEEQEQRDGLSYARASPGNPGFIESESSGSEVKYRGPEAQIYIHGGKGVQWRVFLSGYYRENDYQQSGIFTGYDSSAFVVDSSGSGSGTSRRLSGSFGLDWNVDEDLRVDLGLNLFDLLDQNRFRSRATLSRPSPPSSTTTTRFWEPVTRLQKLEATLGLEHDTSTSFRYGLGLAYTYQYLEVPDLDPSDQDFAKGSLGNFGPRGDIDWHPDKDSRLKASLELLATSGRTPTETQPENGLRAKADLDQGLGAGWDLDVNLLYDKRDNGTSQTHRETLSFGAGLIYLPVDETRLDLRAQYTDFDSSTLSTFYFAPSTTPVPTLVGYEGSNLTLSAGWDQQLAPKLESQVYLAWQHLDGDLASAFLELSFDLEYEISANLRTGIRYSLWDWQDRRDSSQDYRTNALFLYGSYRF